MSAALTIGNLDWTQTFPDACPVITYTWIDTVSQTTPDSTVFTLGASSITVFTSLAAKIGLYPITLSGAVSGFAIASKSFTIGITNHCPTTTLTAVTVPSQTYSVYQPAVTHTFTDWALGHSFCGPVAYIFTTTNSGTGNPAFIKLDSATRTFTF
jgi:hypothetical protein